MAHYRAGGYLGDGFSRLAHITVAKERIGRERIVNYSISRVAAGREAVQSLPSTDFDEGGGDLIARSPFGHSTLPFAGPNPQSYPR